MAEAGQYAGHLARWPGALCDVLVAFVGCLTVTCHIAWLAGLDFATLRWLLLATLPLAAWLVRFWWQAARRDESPDGGALHPGETVVLVLLCVVGSALVVSGHRPDGDDAYYAAMVLAPIEFPDVAMRAIEGNYWNSHYGMTSVPLLQAALASATGLPVLQFYYLWFPAVLAVFVVLAHYELLRCWSRELALTASVLALVVLICWADTHRTHANFGFLRLFQGKAVLVSVFVPLLSAWAWQSGPRGEGPTGRLALGVIAAMGFTPTGLVVPALLLSLVFVSQLLAAPMRTAQMVLLVRRLASVGWYPGLIAVWVIWPKDHAAVRELGVGARLVSDSLVDNFGLVFDLTPRSVLVLATLVLLPLAVSQRHRRVVACWVLLVVLVLFNPWSSQLFRAFADSMAWRLWWALPLPAIAALGGAALTRRLVLLATPATAGSDSRRSLRYLSVAALAGMFALLPGAWVISSANGARLQWTPQPRLETATRMPHRIYKESLVVLGWRVCSRETGRCH